MAMLCVERIVTFLIIAPYKYSYLLTYLLIFALNVPKDLGCSLTDFYVVFSVW